MIFLIFSCLAQFCAQAGFYIFPCLFSRIRPIKNARGCAAAVAFDQTTMKTSQQALRVYNSALACVMNQQHC